MCLLNIEWESGFFGRRGIQTKVRHTIVLFTAEAQIATENDHVGLNWSYSEGCVRNVRLHICTGQPAILVFSAQSLMNDSHNVWPDADRTFWSVSDKITSSQKALNLDQIDHQLPITKNIFCQVLKQPVNLCNLTQGVILLQTVSPSWLLNKDMHFI